LADHGEGVYRLFRFRAASVHAPPGAAVSQRLALNRALADADLLL
jgi:hypothetical protein